MKAIKKRVTVAAPSGKRLHTVELFAQFGAWAATRNVADNGFAVTHLPTGGMIVENIRTRKRAEVLAKKIDGFSPRWKSAKTPKSVMAVCRDLDEYKRRFIASLQLRECAKVVVV